MFTSSPVHAQAAAQSQAPNDSSPLGVERALTAVAHAPFGAAKSVMKQPLIGKQFSLCPDTGEVEDAQRQAAVKQQRLREEEEGGGGGGGGGVEEQHTQLAVAHDHLEHEADNFGSEIVDAKLLASLALDQLDLKLEDPGASELLEVVKSEGGDTNGSGVVTEATAGGGSGDDGSSAGDHFETSLAGLDMVSGVTVSGAVKREPSGAPGGEEEMFGGKVRRVMVGDAAIQQLLSAAGQAQTGPDGRLSFTVDPRLLAATQQQLIMQQQQQQPQPQQQMQQQQLQQLQQQQQLQQLQQQQIVQIQQHPGQQQQLQAQAAAAQPRFLLAWKAENNEFLPMCIPIQAPGGTKLQLASDAGQGAFLAQAPVVSGSAEAPAAIQVPANAAMHGHGTQIIQLPTSSVIPALTQGATLQLPPGSFPGLAQTLQLPSSGLLQAAGAHGTILQLPTSAAAMTAAGGDFPQGATILQIPAAHFATAAAAAAQQVPPQGHQELLVPAAEHQAAGEAKEGAGAEPDVDTDAGDEKGLPCDDVSSSSMADETTAAAAAAAAALSGVGDAEAAVAAACEGEEELEVEEERDPESWRLRHAVTILEKSQINFLRDARRSFKCYQCGGLIKPPALEVEVDLAPYGIRPVLCTDCGKFHLNKRNVNVRVTTDEGCEQLHRFMSA